MSDTWQRILDEAAAEHRTWVSVVIAHAPMGGIPTAVKNGSARWGCPCGVSGLADDERRAHDAAAEHRRTRPTLSPREAQTNE